MLLYNWLLKSDVRKTDLSYTAYTLLKGLSVKVATI